MLGADGAGLNCCASFKAFHMLTNMLVCQSTSSGGVPAAMKSNHICFQVTFLGTVKPIELVFWLSKLPLYHASIMSLLHVPYPRFVSFLQIFNGLSTIANILSHN